MDRLISEVYTINNEQEAIRELEIMRKCFKSFSVQYQALSMAIKALAIPSAEPNTGHWIMTGDYYTGAYGCIEYVECSCCHEDSLEEGDYCPNCGAKMVEPQESEKE